MSFQITTAFVEGFKNNIYMLSQQKKARLFGKSRMETQASEKDNYERIGVVEAQPVTERHGDTPILNTPHSRRSVTLEDTEWGDMIDRLDRVRLLINPDDAYVQSAIMSLNRQKDDVFIAAALGNAFTGKKGTIAVPLPDTQKIVAIDEDGVTGAVGLNVFTLTLVQAKFDEADIDEEIIRYFAISGKQRQNLLRDPQLTDQDFAVVKALVQGKTDFFMNFNFIRSQRLPVTAAVTNYDLVTGDVGAGAALPAGARRCFAWIGDGMISVTGEDLFVDVGPRRDKKMNTQVFVEHSVGSVRMEEEKVIEIIVIE